MKQREAVRSGEQPVEVGVCTAAKKTILVVEDLPDFVRAVSRKLRSRGFEVMVARDGASAMDAVREREPDLVVLDVDLSGGEGLATLARMRELPSHSGRPVVVLGSGADPMTRTRALEAGAAEFVAKSAAHELFQTIERILASRRADADALY